jgi:hypothetical protein
MMLKWFRGLHFKLQTKIPIFEESMHAISLKTMIVVNPFDFHTNYDIATCLQLKLPNLM